MKKVVIAYLISKSTKFQNPSDSLFVGALEKKGVFPSGRKMVAVPNRPEKRECLPELNLF
jgi:hypothetical protein